MISLLITAHLTHLITAASARLTHLVTADSVRLTHIVTADYSTPHTYGHC